MQASSQVFFFGEGAIQQGDGQNMHQSHERQGGCGGMLPWEILPVPRGQMMENWYFAFFDKNIILFLQFGLSKSNLEPLKIIKNETNIVCYFLQWAGLRAAIPQMLN